jgi:O-methyltransferase involved in polyketide biosynthesis
MSYRYIIFYLFTTTEGVGMKYLLVMEGVPEQAVHEALREIAANLKPGLRVAYVGDQEVNGYSMQDRRRIKVQVAGEMRLINPGQVSGYMVTEKEWVNTSSPLTLLNASGLATKVDYRWVMRPNGQVEPV